jgi:hypothetical protein
MIDIPANDTSEFDSPIKTNEFTLVLRDTLFDPTASTNCKIFVSKIDPAI